MKKPIIGQRYVHNADGHAIHVKSELTGGNYKTTRGMMTAEFIEANYKAEDYPKHPRSVLITDEQKKAAQVIYGSLTACFLAGLKAGGYHG